MSNAPTRKTGHEATKLARGRPRLEPVTRRRKGAERVSLRTIRESIGKTQVEVARALETDQGEVSRIERRSDVMVSTLRKYAAALGAHCEVSFVFRDGRRVLIAEAGDRPPPSPVLAAGGPPRTRRPGQ